MSCPLSPEIYAAAARSIGWPSIARISPSDVTLIMATHRLNISWAGNHVMVHKPDGPGHVESVGYDPDGALFTAVVLCAALVGGA